jgi:hypothetical protein
MAPMPCTKGTDMKTASWIIVNKATRVAVFETFNENTAKAVNTRLYEAVPILEYLQQLNRAIKAGQA